MISLRLTLIASFLIFQYGSTHAPGASKFLPKRDPCIPLAQGWEAIDDSLAINDALRACGNGGIIKLPSDQVYSIRTPIDFSPCKNCDFQIEGTLIAARGQWDYWNSVDSIFTLAGVKGVRIRSVTGTGLVDGNAIDYYMGRWDSGYMSTKSFAHITNGSEDVVIQDLRLKNVMQVFAHRFFRSEGNSTNVKFLNLSLSMEQQWGMSPRNEYDAAGIELGRTSNIKISNIDMYFQSRENHGGTVGVCIAIDVGTHDVEARNVTCKGAWGGALVSLNSIGNLFPTSEEQLDTVSHIYVKDFKFDGDTATGFRSLGVNSTMKNITWDDVTMINGNPASAKLCWVKNHTMTDYVFYCMENLVSRVMDIWFKNFRGGLPAMPNGEGWEHVNNKTITEYHFVGWENSTVP